MAASSSSGVPRKTYDVFISFRGEDTRCNFTSHLHSALRRRKIKTYFDEEDLSRGEEISPGLLRAIEGSQLSLVVFSKNYANSSWCLDELLHILWCKRNRQQQVIPVFYHVDPSDVRKQKRSYGKTFGNLDQRFKEDKNKLQNWRLALNEVAGFAGFSTQDIRFRSESNLVEAIVEDIIKNLNSSSSLLIGSENLVGIEKSVEQIEALLQNGSPNIRAIGIWGPGGIGKTTIARFIFWKLCSEFEGCCFLENVREEWEKKRREKYHLQNVFFSNLLGEKDTSLITSFVIPTFVIDRLRHTKCLIVLDDVNDEEQLESLIGSCEFGLGSRIIVTSRDVQCLRNDLVHAIYEVKGLNYDEARQLFCLNALKRNSMAPLPTELLESVDAYAEGNPLVLKVLGSLFNHNGRENWVTLLKKLKSSRGGEKIQNALMISYNDLSQWQKDVFLDIACFFKDCDRHDVERILEDQGFFVNLAIDDLVDKSLITINYREELCMHDLVQEMGREVVRKQSSKPGKRSRLYDSQEIYHVLKTNTAREEIQGILLDMSEIEEVNLSPDVFKRTYNLRVLKIINEGCDRNSKLHLPEGLELLPDRLKYFHWDDYPSKSLPSKLASEKLVEIIMTNSQVEQLWEGVQNLSNLRRIDLSCSHNLTEIPDLSNAPKLEEIRLDCCSSLNHVPKHKFQNLDRLRFLSMSECEKLQALPHIIQSVEYLGLDDCINPKTILDIKKENVFILDLRGTGIKELPKSIGTFNNLKTLPLQGCKDLKNLPSSICQLKLECLDLRYCSSLEEIPELLPRTLIELFLDGTAIEEVPSSSIELLSNLTLFSLRRCERLRNLPTSICKLKSLEELDLSECSKFEDFPEILEPMRHLHHLDLSYTPMKTLPLSIKNLCALITLNLSSCPKLKFEVGNISKLENVKHVTGRGFADLHDPLLENCNMLEIPDNWLPGIKSVSSLNINKQNHDEIPATIARLSNLKCLYICEWKNLQSLPDLPLDLHVLDARGCTLLESVSSSRNAILKYFVNESVYPYSSKINFFNCLKLDQSARDNVAFDGQLRILRSAIYALSPEFKSGHFDRRTSYICYPDCEIPEWFVNQVTGSSITIQLPSNWLNNKFLGFSLCVVITCKDCCFEDLELGVDFYLMTSSGEQRASNYSLFFAAPTLPEESFASSDLDHVLMLHEYTSAREVYNTAACNITEVSFQFRLALESVHGSCKVKRCGIRMLYLQDVENLGVSIHPYYWGRKRK